MNWFVLNAFVVCFYHWNRSKAVDNQQVLNCVLQSQKEVHL